MVVTYIWVLKIILFKKISSMKYGILRCDTKASHTCIKNVWCAKNLVILFPNCFFSGSTSDRLGPVRLFHVPQGRLPPTYITEQQQSTL